MILSRRSAIHLAAAASAASAATLAAPSSPSEARTAGMQVLEAVRTELIMNLVVTCSRPERMGPNTGAPDGERQEIWPIIGGRFEGLGVRGTVIPGGGDFPVKRPDGVEVVDALYRLLTDDGVQIIIHNRGMAYTEDKYRLVPVFTVTAGKYDWLNRSIFIATLIYPPPPEMRLAKGQDQNDRLIQVHRVL